MCVQYSLAFDNKRCEEQMLAKFMDSLELLSLSLVLDVRHSAKTRGGFSSSAHIHSHILLLGKNYREKHPVLQQLTSKRENKESRSLACCGSQGLAVWGKWFWVQAIGVEVFPVEVSQMRHHSLACVCYCWLCACGGWCYITEKTKKAYGCYAVLELADSGEKEERVFPAKQSDTLHWRQMFHGSLWPYMTKLLHKRPLETIPIIALLTPPPLGVHLLHALWSWVGMWGSSECVWFIFAFSAGSAVTKTFL